MLHGTYHPAKFSRSAPSAVRPIRHRGNTEVYDGEFKYVFSIPNHKIFHLPPPEMDISRLVLCKNFSVFNPNSCTMGDSCKFVHADVSGPDVKREAVHINYAWRSPDLVTYDRLPAGEVLEVYAPNNRAPVTPIPSEYILATKGSLGRHQRNAPLSHCAHYYFNRACHRGEKCGFIHAIHIDPTAADFQRAPPRSAVDVNQLQHISTHSCDDQMSSAQSNILVRTADFEDEVLCTSPGYDTASENNTPRLCAVHKPCPAAAAAAAAPVYACAPHNVDVNEHRIVRRYHRNPYSLVEVIVPC